MRTIPLDKLRDIILPRLSVRAAELFSDNTEVSDLCTRTAKACTFSDEQAMLSVYEEFRSMGVPEK